MDMTVAEVKNSLYNYTFSYKDLRDDFSYILSDYCKKYVVDSIDGCCDCIVSDILITLKEEIDKILSHNKGISLKDISRQINYEAIIEDILNDYNTDVPQLVGYKVCLDYLIEHDISLRKSLELAKELGYNIDELDVEKLANILYRYNQENNFEEFKDDVMAIMKIYCEYYTTHVYKVKK
jgi:hypothetical protein